MARCMHQALPTMISALACVVALALFGPALSLTQSGPAVQLPTLSLPPGFSIQLYTQQNVTGARSIAIGGTEASPIVYVSSNGPGVVSAVIDRNQTGTPTVCTLIKGLNNPEGLAYFNGSLFVGQVTNVTRYDNVDNVVRNGNCTGLPAPVLIASPFPSTTDHNARHIEIGPDNKLYISYGSPANVDTCEQYGNINSCSIIRMNMNGTQIENYLVGIRNTVGFTWQPVTSQFFFNMIERDLLGDNRPDDVLFLGGPIGTNYTWPYCHREGLGDPYNRTIGPGVSFGDPDVHNANQTSIIQSNPANLNQSLSTYCNSTTVAPLMTLGPHVSPLGLKFYTGSMFPAEYNGSLFIPEHGSWNRPLEIGYRVVNVKLNSNNAVIDHQIFASGWLQNQNTTQQSVWGRPVATGQLPDGSLLLSDDSTNALYRITYSAAGSPSMAPGPLRAAKSPAASPPLTVAG